MPYRIEQSGSGYYVVSDSGKRRSKRALSKKRAQAQMRALYANDPHARTKSAIDVLPPTCTLDDLYNYAVKSGTSYQQEVADVIAARVPEMVTLKGERIAPGITRIRGNLCNVHGRYGPCDAALSGGNARATIDRNKRINAAAARGSGGKGRATAKPKKTEEQKRAEQEAKKRERDAEREKKQEEADTARRAERDRIMTEAGIDKNLQGALLDAREGNTLTAINGAKLAEQGLAEQGADGSYRLSPKGTQLVNAANRGDAGEVARVQGEARDQVAKQRQRTAERSQRQQEREARRAEAERRRRERQSRGGGGKKTEPKKEIARPQTPRRRGSSGGSSGGSRSPSSSSSAGAIGRRAETRRRREERAARETTRQRERTQRERTRQEEQARRAADQAERARVTTPEIANVARKLSEGGEISEQEQETLIRNGLARRDRDGRMMLTGTGLRASRQKEASPREQHDHSKQQEKQQEVQQQQKEETAYVVIHSASIPSSFAVFKDAKGCYRWISHTTTAYRDRDGEILTLKGLEANARRMTETGIYGPLRYWHIGQPNPFSDTEPWGAGLDIGDCDFSMLIGRTLVESGTFRSPAIAEKMASDTAGHEVSPGFFHSASEPDADGAFEQFFIFERSPVPRDYARASNLFTAFRVKEHRMDPQEFERRLKVAEQKLGLSPEQTAAERAALLQTDKDASERKIAFKSDDAPQVYTAPDGTAGIIQDGRFVALKAAAVEEALPAVEEKADVVVEEMVEEAADEGGEETYVGDMTPGEFRALLIDALQTAIVGSMGAISDKVATLDNELKTFGYARQKEAGEVAVLKEQIEARTKEATDLAARLAELEGDQPRAVKSGFRASLNGPVADAATLKELNAPQPPVGTFDDINQFLLGANGVNGAPRP
jgi:hypothetical protein